MKSFIWILALFLFMEQLTFSQDSLNQASDFIIAFGSCNKQDSPQPYWEEILKNDPDLFIWGGDTIYGDSEDMPKIENELKSITSDFTIIVSSIQFLSGEHGWECWANFPREIERLKQMIVSNEVKNAIILSGDRHISEFPKIEMDELSYPLIDFTSSGLTHAYTKYTGEPNRYRSGEVVFTPSFGILKFNFDKKELTIQMRGENNILLQEIRQQYPE